MSSPFYQCPQCGGVNDRASCPCCEPRAERSGVPQGCLPSANCSAEAGAEAKPNSLISSVVPPKEAVRRDSHIETLLGFIELWMKSDIALYHDSPFISNLEHRLDVLREIRRELSKPPALPAQRERAIRRNNAMGQPSALKPLKDNETIRKDDAG